MILKNISINNIFSAEHSRVDACIVVAILPFFFQSISMNINVVLKKKKFKSIKIEL